MSKIEVSLRIFWVTLVCLAVIKMHRNFTVFTNTQTCRSIHTYTKNTDTCTHTQTHIQKKAYNTHAYKRTLIPPLSVCPSVCLFIYIYIYIFDLRFTFLQYASFTYVRIICDISLLSNTKENWRIAILRPYVLKQLCCWLLFNSLCINYLFIYIYI